VERLAMLAVLEGRVAARRSALRPVAVEELKARSETEPATGRELATRLEKPTVSP
jgi:hypothetical protein